MDSHNIDQHWMKIALRAAGRGWGRTSPNPMVGAVVVRDGQLMGAGWHHRAGSAHAEVEALRAAGAGARGATVYVTLEPCTSHGRTPPCVDALIAAGVRRCVWAVADPDSRHRGRAHDILAKAGIETCSGILGDAAAHLNRAFFCHAVTGRPWVLLKMAMTLDGRIATKAGQSQWITGPPARREVQRIRRWADAILVGGDTVRRDNPSLLVRSPKNWPRQPLRLIATRQSLDALQLANGARPAMLSDGCGTVRSLACGSRAEIMEVLGILGREGIQGVLVEGGGELAGRLLQADCVDEIAFFIAPCILTGRDSRPVVGGDLVPESLQQAMQLQQHRCRRIGNDYLMEGLLHHVHRID